MATAAAAGRPSVGKLAPEETALLVCDVQERFRSVISGFPAVVDTSRRMVRLEHKVDMGPLFKCKAVTRRTPAACWAFLDPGWY